MESYYELITNYNINPHNICISSLDEQTRKSPKITYYSDSEGSNVVIYPTHKISYCTGLNSHLINFYKYIVEFPTLKEQFSKFAPNIEKDSFYEEIKKRPEFITYLKKCASINQWPDINFDDTFCPTDDAIFYQYAVACLFSHASKTSSNGYIKDSKFYDPYANSNMAVLNYLSSIKEYDNNKAKQSTKKYPECDGR
jgi:hypothetical protein